MTAIAIFGLATATLAQVPSYAPTSGLVGWYPFNGNANDQSVNSLNGNVVGGPTLTTDRNSIANASYDFDYTTATFGGQTDEVYIPYNAILNSSAITVSVWVYPRSYFWTGNPNASVIINRFQYGYSNPNGQVWGIWMDPTNLNAFILAAAPDNNQTSASVQGPTLPLNVWSNVVFSYNGSSLKLYVNGVLVNTTATSILLNTAGNSGISIGESNQANGYWSPTDGKIDDIGIWNRALTECEVNQLFVSQLVDTGIDIQTACNSYVWIDGMTYSSSNNTATYLMQNSSGCDSLVTLNLTVNNSTTGTDIQTACDSYTWIDGMTYSSSNNTATYLMQNSSGCDSLVTLDLTMNNSSSSTLNESAMDSYTLNGQTYSQSGTYTQVIPNAEGCDSTITLNLTMNYTGIDDLKENLFSVFPNPASTQISVKADVSLVGSVYTIFDNVGKVVLSGKITSENTIIELDNLSGGIYLFSIGGNMNQTFKVIKE